MLCRGRTMLRTRTQAPKALAPSFALRVRTRIATACALHSPCVRTRTCGCALPARRAVPAALPCRSSRAAAVSVVAFRDHHHHTHRSERLVAVANEFVHHWIKGIREGPTEAVLSAFNTIVDPDITLSAKHLLGSFEGKGIEGLQGKLLMEQHTPGMLQPVRVVYSAADDDADVVFCLVECEASGIEEGRPGCKGYAIVKFDVLLDDTTWRITGVTARRQLSPADNLLLCARPGEEGEVVQAINEAAHFPQDHITASLPKDWDPEQVRRHAVDWCNARSSSMTTQLLDRVADPTCFQMWDAYGVLPAVCSLSNRPPGEVQADPPRGRCVAKLPQVKELISKTKERYHIDCSQVDCAVSRTHNIGFTHWRSHIRRIDSEGKDFLLEGELFEVDCMELDVYTPEGKLRDVWMLRDPMDFERAMLQEVKDRCLSKTAGSPEGRR